MLNKFSGVWKGLVILVTLEKITKKIVLALPFATFVVSGD